METRDERGDKSERGAAPTTNKRDCSLLLCLFEYYNVHISQPSSTPKPTCTLHHTAELHDKESHCTHYRHYRHDTPFDGTRVVVQGRLYGQRDTKHNIAYIFLHLIF